MTTTSVAAAAIAAPARCLAAIGKARIIGALLLGALLAGCGFLQLGYNNSPELLHHWLDGYLDFDAAQAPRVRADLERLQRWHRAEELPRYAELLDRLAQQVAGELNAEAVCSAFDEARTRFSALLDAAEPAIAALALDLSPAQLRHLEQKFDQQNAKYRKTWIDAAPQQRFAARLERATKQAERVYGPLEAAQRAVLREQLLGSAFDPVQTLAETRRRQRDTLATLRQLGTDRDWTLQQVRAGVHGWLQRLLRSPDAAARAHQQRIEQQGCANVAGLHNSTTAAQRAHAAGRLRGWARDFRELGGTG